MNVYTLINLISYILKARLFLFAIQLDEKIFPVNPVSLFLQKL